MQPNSLPGLAPGPPKRDLSEDRLDQIRTKGNGNCRGYDAPVSKEAFRHGYWAAVGAIIQAGLVLLFALR